MSAVASASSGGFARSGSHTSGLATYHTNRPNGQGTSSNGDGGAAGAYVDEDADQEEGEEGDEEEDGVASFFVRALYDFTSDDPSSLSFKKGALIEVLTQLESGWWDGLLGNDVRGWFPSNYVEVISDEEAERELRERAQQFMAKNAAAQSAAAAAVAGGGGDSGSVQASQVQGGASAIGGALNSPGIYMSSSSIPNSPLSPNEASYWLTSGEAGAASLDAALRSSFDGLGLGKEFDPLRALMSGEGLNTNDAFEELAEAAMSRQRDGSNGVAGASASGSEASYDLRAANAAANGGYAEEEEEADNDSTATIGQLPDIVAQKGVQVQHTNDRPRGNSLPQENVSASHLPGRRRAETSAATASLKVNDGPVQEEYGTPNTHISGSEDEELENTSPGGTAWQPSNSSRHRGPRRWGEEPQANASTTLIDGSSSRTSRSNTMDSSNSKFSTGLVSNGSKATTLSTLGSMRDPPAANALEHLPGYATELRGLPWVLRLTDDEQAFFYYNVESKESRWDLPADVQHTMSTASDNKLTALRDVGRRPSAITLSSLDSTDDKADPVEAQGAPGRSAAKVIAARARSGTGNMAAAPFAALGKAGQPVSQPTGVLVAPITLQKDMEQALRLQSQVREPEGGNNAALARLQENMAECLSKVMAVISEFGTRSKTDRDAVGKELSQAVSSTLKWIRAVLYTAGSVAISPDDLEAIAHYNKHSSTTLNAFPRDASATVGGHIGQLYRSSTGKQGIPVITPPSIQVPSRKVAQTLSKLILSTRTLVELNRLDSVQTPVDVESAQVLVYRMEQRRQRVREDATDLLRAASVLSAELDKLRGAAAQAGPHSVWPKRLEPLLKSGEGAAGIDAESLSGGSAAGWRGSGFALPTPKETAALRADAMGHFTNPFDLTKEMQNLLSSGRTTLRRRPEQPLTAAYLNEVLQPRQEALRVQLLDLRKLIRMGTMLKDRSGTPTPLAEPTRNIDEKSIVEPPAVQDLLAAATMVLQKAGQYITLLEKIDLAIALDFDGAASDPKEYTDLVARARLFTQDFVQTKQDLHDRATSILADAQDAVATTFEARIDREAAEDVLASVDDLVVSSDSAQELLRKLVDVAAEQQRLGSGKIGARAKVYGVVDLPAPAVSSAERATDRKDTTTPDDRSGVLYLGPGIAVPDGPDDQKRSRLGAGGTRGRSASSATSGSGIGHRRADGLEEGDSFKSPRSDKIKKFFGDEAPSQDLEAAVKRVEADPWFLEVDYSPNDIVLTSEGQVKGATLGALMERLSMHNNYDASFNNTFLLTYRSFTNTEEFLDLLFARFRKTMPPGLTPLEQNLWIEKKQRPIQLRVFNVLKSWLETYLKEGEDEKYLDRIRVFAEEEMAALPNMNLASKQLLRLIERRQGEGEMQVRKMVMPNSAPPPVLPKNLRKIKFLDIDPLEMARQLTLLESKLYCRIKPFECLDKSWSKKESDRLAPGIKDTISTSNRITGWVAEAILMQEDLKKRASWMRQFIAIADRCRSLQNFSTMTAIVSGLNSAPVYRLRRTWDQVNQRYIAMLESLNKVMHSSKNFSDYREMIHKLNPPCVPFLGVYLTDLTFIEDGNPDRLKTDERLINFGKRHKTAEVVKEIMIYQATPYNLTPVPGIQKFINDNLVETRTDNDLYQQSLVLEPREREDERIARLLQESGFL